jgi:hypothetical protein
LYKRARAAEAQLDRYENTIAEQVATLTARYEGLCCYLLKKLGWDGVSEKAVSEWAKGKQFALSAEIKKDDIIWSAVVKVDDEE